MKIVATFLFDLLNILFFCGAAQQPGYLISKDGDSLSGNISR